MIFFFIFVVSPFVFRYTSAGIFTFKRAAFVTQLTAKVGSSLAKSLSLGVSVPRTMECMRDV